jgi:hypothetical protein
LWFTNIHDILTPFPCPASLREAGGKKEKNKENTIRFWKDRFLGKLHLTRTFSFCPIQTWLKQSEKDLKSAKTSNMVNGRTKRKANNTFL